MSTRPTYHRIHLVLTLGLLFLAATMSATGQAANADPATSNASVYVVRIVYSGNSRTQVSTMDRLTGLKPGIHLNDVDFDRVTASLMGSGVFSSAKVESNVVNGEATLTVLVKERSNVALIPYNITIEDSFYGGGLLYTDSDFLGLAKRFSVGMSWSNLGPAGIVSYTDPSFLFENLSTTTFITGGSFLRQEVAMNGKQYAQFPYQYEDLGLRLDYPFREGLHVLGTIRGFHVTTDPMSGLEYDLERDSLNIIPSLGVSYNGQAPLDYFAQGPLAAVEYSHGFRVIGFQDFDSIQFQGKWTAGIPFGGFIEVGTSAQYGNQSLIARKPLTRNGFRTLPPNSYSDKNVGTFASIDIPVLRFDQGVVAMGPFYEAGYYATGLDASPVLAMFHGPGLGLHFFVKGVTSQAIGADVAYNAQSNQFNFAINGGLSLN